MPRVSVVIPVLNSAPFLPQCLDSILAQTLDDIEVICVNDGSTDGSDEILANYAARDSRLTVLEQETLGLSVARNRGFDATTGEYILFLDSDDFFEPTLAEHAYARCVADDADIAVFSTRHYYEDSGLLVDADWSLRTEFMPASIPFNAEDMAGRIFRFAPPCVWNRMLRRSFVAEQALRFSPQLKRAEDVPFVLLGLAKARRITVINEYLVNYRRRSVGSLQATAHETPLEIVKAFSLLKGQLIEAGEFEARERDFVNAAVDHSLFTLDTLCSSEAHAELYEALKNRYFEELGILGRTQDYFYEPRHFEQYSRVMDNPREQYLFLEMRRVAVLAKDKSVEADVLRAELAKAKADADSAAVRVEAVLVQQGDLEDELATIRARLFDDLKTTQQQLITSRERLTASSAKLAATEKKLKSVRRSRAYKVGRRLTSLPRAVRRMFGGTRGGASPRA